MPFLAWTSMAALASESDQRFCMCRVLADSVVLSEAKDLIAACNRHQILRFARDDTKVLLPRLQFRDRLGHHCLLVPGEEDPGVLAHLGDEGVDRGATGGFRIDRGEMGLGE